MGKYKHPVSIKVTEETNCQLSILREFGFTMRGVIEQAVNDFYEQFKRQHTHKTEGTGNIQNIAP